MIVFKLAVKRQELTLSEQSSPVEKTRDLIQCVFDFQTDDWEGAIKTAYFRNEKTGIITSQVLSDNQCLIPHEALSDTGYITFSVAGEKEGYRITSSSVQFFNRATVYGGNSSDPTPSQYEQIMAAAAAAQNAAESAEQTAADIKQQADSGAFNGEQGPQGEAGPQGPKGDTGPQGEKGDVGEQGIAATISVGKTTTAEAGTPASVVNVGTENNAIFDFIIPKGEKGEQGASSVSARKQLSLADYPNYTNSLDVNTLETGIYDITEGGWIGNGTIINNRKLQLQKGAIICWDTVNLIIIDRFIYVIYDVLNDVWTTSYIYTSNEATQALLSKQNKPKISIESTSNITLNNNTEYRLQVTETLNLTLPSSIADDYECSLVFESGDTATVLSYAADSIKFVGDDCDAEGDFIPQANKGYEVNIKNLGYDRIVARVGAF